MSPLRICVSGDNILSLSKISVQKFANILTYVIITISDENRSDSPFIFDAFPGVPRSGKFVIRKFLS